MITFIESPENKMLTIRFQENILCTNAPQISQQIFNYLDHYRDNAPPWNTITLDFNKLTMVDSVGFSMIMELANWGKDHEIELTAKVRARQLRKIFHMLKLDVMITLNNLN